MLSENKINSLKKSKSLALFTSIIATGAYLIMYSASWMAKTQTGILSAQTVAIGMGGLAIFALGYYSFVTIYLKKRSGE